MKVFKSAFYIRQFHRWIGRFKKVRDVSTIIYSALSIIYKKTRRNYYKWSFDGVPPRTPDPSPIYAYGKPKFTSGQCCAANFMRFCFCRWLQNQTRTTFFFRSSFSAMAAIFSPEGRGCTAK